MSGATILRFGAIAGGIAALAMLAACARETEQAKEVPKTFGEIIAAEVPDDGASLLELAGSDTGTKGFYALLKLRDVGNNQAVPVLEKVLARESATTRTNGFAAAQALFCIGTPESHEVLSRYLASPAYDVHLGIRYGFHWEMDAAKRDAFIEKYHLTSTSEDLMILLTTTSGVQDGKQEIVFTVTLQNVSGSTLRVRDPQVYLGRMLVLRSADGHSVDGLEFVDRLESAEYKRLPDTFPELAPKATRTYRIVARPRWEVGGRWERMLPKEGGMVLDCRDFSHFIVKAGKYQVRALFAERPLTQEQAAFLKGKPEDFWSGRVVSDPVEIQIEAIPKS